VNQTRRQFATTLGAVAAGVAFFPSRARAAGDLRIAFVPEVATSPASISEKQPFVDYFAKATGANVKLIIPTNYAATVEAFGNGSLDLAYFGGLTYLKASALYGAKPVAQRVEDRNFHSLFITNSPAINSLKDLKGKQFAFGDVNSTSGHLIPVKELLEAGIDPDKDILSHFMGNHTTTALAVASGRVAAGALDESVYKKMVEDKQIDPAKVRVFYTSKPFIDYVWAVRKDLDPALVGKIRSGFLEMSDPKVLSIVRGTKYVVANDQEYDALRVVAKKIGLL
jgi:phosphonate transport system substrate-binding protein